MTTTQVHTCSFSQFDKKEREKKKVALIWIFPIKSFLGPAPPQKCRQIHFPVSSALSNLHVHYYTSIYHHCYLFLYYYHCSSIFVCNGSGICRYLCCAATKCTLYTRRCSHKSIKLDGKLYYCVCLINRYIKIVIYLVLALMIIIVE